MSTKRGRHEPVHSRGLQRASQSQHSQVPFGFHSRAWAVEGMWVNAWGMVLSHSGCPGREQRPHTLGTGPTQGSPEASISILLNCPSHSEPEDPYPRDTRNWSPRAGGGGLVVQGGMQTRTATMEKGLRKFNRVTFSLDPRELNAEMQASAYVHGCQGWREPSAHHWMKG